MRSFHAILTRMSRSHYWTFRMVTMILVAALCSSAAGTSLCVGAEGHVGVKVLANGPCLATPMLPGLGVATDLSCCEPEDDSCGPCVDIQISVGQLATSKNKPYKPLPTAMMGNPGRGPLASCKLTAVRHLGRQYVSPPKLAADYLRSTILLI